MIQENAVSHGLLSDEFIITFYRYIFIASIVSQKCLSQAVFKLKGISVKLEKTLINYVEGKVPKQM